MAGHGGTAAHGGRGARAGGAGSGVTGAARRGDAPEGAEMAGTAARLGLAGKGLLYLVVGTISVRVATGTSGGNGSQGQTGAIRSLAQEGIFGTVLLWLLGIGLTGYAVWRLVQAFGDPDEDSALVRIGWRASYVIRAGIYGTFAFLTWSALGSGGGGGGGNGGARTATARVLALPGGAWIVGGVGAVIVAVGLYQGRKALDTSFMEGIGLRGRMARHRTAVVRLGRAGHAARTVVFVMSGVFVIRAATSGNSSEARGLDGALAELAAQPHGTALLLVVALGLAAYGIYCLVVAPYLVDTDA